MFHLKLKNCIFCIIGGMILAFGLYNIHSLSRVTEGGALGLSLLLDHWFSISPALSGLAANLLCYLIGWKILGKKFIAYSAFSALAFSGSYRLFECFPPIWPQIADHPFLAAVLGALFVGVGVGLCVRMGGAPTGDDALAMGLSHWFKIGIQWFYLIGDLVVIALSATYIPWQRLIWSLLTVILSGQIVGFFQKKNED